MKKDFILHGLVTQNIFSESTQHMWLLSLKYVNIFVAVVFVSLYFVTCCFRASVADSLTNNHSSLIAVGWNPARHFGTFRVRTLADGTSVVLLRCVPAHVGGAPEVFLH